MQKVDLGKVEQFTRGHFAWATLKNMIPESAMQFGAIEKYFHKSEVPQDGVREEEGAGRPPGYVPGESCSSRVVDHIQTETQVIDLTVTE